MSMFVPFLLPQEEAMRITHLRKLLAILILAGEPPAEVAAAIDEEWHFLERYDRIIRECHSRIPPFSAN